MESDEKKYQFCDDMKCSNKSILRVAYERQHSLEGNLFHVDGALTQNYNYEHILHVIRSFPVRSIKC